jgi:hypothetical protein
MSSQQQLEGEEQSTTTHEEVIVGGYSNLDNTLIKSEAVLDIANFAVEEHAARISQLFGSGGQQQQLSEDDTFLEISPEDVESGLIHIVVLEAQRQVKFRFHPSKLFSSYLSLFQICFLTRSSFPFFL